MKIPMTRRGFLQALGLGTIASAIPNPKSIDAKPSVLPTISIKDYGNHHSIKSGDMVAFDDDGYVIPATDKDTIIGRAIGGRGQLVVVKIGNEEINLFANCNCIMR